MKSVHALLEMSFALLKFYVDPVSGEPDLIEHGQVPLLTFWFCVGPANLTQEVHQRSVPIYLNEVEII